MLLRWVIVGFYAISVALFAGFVHLVGLFNQMLVDGTPKLKYEYIIGEYTQQIIQNNRLIIVTIYSWCRNCWTNSCCRSAQWGCAHIGGRWIHDRCAGHSVVHANVAAQCIRLGIHNESPNTCMSGVEGATQSLAGRTRIWRFADSKLYDVDTRLPGRLSRLVFAARRVWVRERCRAVFWVSSSKYYINYARGIKRKNDYICIIFKSELI